MTQHALYPLTAEKSMALLIRFWFSFSVNPVTRAPVEERLCGGWRGKHEVDVNGRGS